jgi:hypothetical protein
MPVKTAKASEDNPDRPEIEPDPAWLAATLGYLKSVYEQGELTDGVLGLASSVLRGIECDDLPNPSLRVIGEGSFNIRWYSKCGCILALTFIDNESVRWKVRFCENDNGKPGDEGPFYIETDVIACVRELVVDFHGRQLHRKHVLFADLKKGGRTC